MFEKAAIKSIVTIMVITLSFSVVNSAKAQSGSAQVLLEMQAMRAEIADLRDMVERQQFELKKLQRRNDELAAAQAETKANLEAQSAARLQYSGRGVYDDYQDNPMGGLTPTEAQSGYPSQGMNDLGVQNSQQPGSQGSQNTIGQPSTNAVNPEQIEPAQTQSQVDASTFYTQVETTEGGQQPSRSGPEIVERGFTYTDPNTQPIPQSVAGATPIEQSNPMLEGAEPTTVADNNSVNINGTAPSSPILSVPKGVVDQGGEQAAINAGVVPTDPAALETPVRSVVPQTPQFTEDQYYDQGFDFLKQSKYEEAIDTFNTQIGAYPTGDLADDAHYWIAEAYFISRKPAQAKPHLRSIIDNYPRSARLPDAMLKTAYIEQDMGNMIEARIMLQEIVARHPSSNAAIAARNRLANLQGNN